MNKRKLELLDFVKEMYPYKVQDDIMLIACQHVLTSTHIMLDYITSLGIKKENIYIIGKCYSTCYSSYQKIVNDGYNISPYSILFVPEQSYDQQFAHNVKVFLEEIRKANPQFKKIIILDDGGEIVHMAPKIFGDSSILFGVEQTSAGYNLIKSHPIMFPLYNVARCKLKTDLEYAFLSEIIIKELKNKVYHLMNSNKNCLVIGNGNLGRILKNKLREYFIVTSYDINPRKSEVEFKDIKLKKYDIIIGTSGKKSLPNALHRDLKKRCVLASVSSSDREFDAYYFRQNRDVTNCHTDITSENEINLLNCGFPINFSGEKSHSIPLKKIQLTIALLFASICEGLFNPTNKRKILYLQKSLQGKIKDYFLKVIT